MNENEQLKVFLNPLAFVPAMEGSPGGARPDPPPESVLDFLCTPGVDSRVAALVRRCREISAEPEPLFAAPADERILEKLVWPLLHAKGSYMLGNYLGTISLCGMVAEMLAILIFEVAQPNLNGQGITERLQRDLFGGSFEKLGQQRRVTILHACDVINDELKDSFDRIRDNPAPIPPPMVQGLWQPVHRRRPLLPRRTEGGGLRSRSNHSRWKAGSECEAHPVSPCSRRARGVGRVTIAQQRPSRKSAASQPKAPAIDSLSATYSS